MRPIYPLVLAILLLPNAGYSQIILMTPQPPLYGSGARGYPSIIVTPGYGGIPGGYPGNSRLGGLAGDMAGSGNGSFAATTPCIPSGVDAPPPPSQFRPPISPNYRAFSDRFAPPPQPSSQLLDNCN